MAAACQQKLKQQLKKNARACSNTIGVCSRSPVQMTKTLIRHMHVSRCPVQMTCVQKQSVSANCTTSCASATPLHVGELYLQDSTKNELPSHSSFRYKLFRASKLQCVDKYLRNKASILVCTVKAQSWCIVLRAVFTSTVRTQVTIHHCSMQWQRCMRRIKSSCLVTQQ